MKFPWVRCGDGMARPIVRSSFRRGSTALPTAILVIVDTGADTTVLPFALVSMLGFSTSELESIETNAVGGKVKTWKAKAGAGVTGVEVEIGGFWFGLPSLAFAENTPPLLGRDVLFANFDLRMTAGETELRPKK